MRFVAPSTIAASTTCPLPDFSRSNSAQDDAERAHQSAAGEVADEVDRRERTLVTAADRVERAGDRDVVDVVSGARGRAGRPGPSR